MVEKVELKQVSPGCIHPLDNEGRNRILFEKPTEEVEPEEPQEQATEHPGGRRWAIQQVIARIMGEGYVNTCPIIFGQTEGTSSNGKVGHAVSGRFSTRKGSRFLEKKPSYPFKIDPQEQARFDGLPTFSSKEIREHREALGFGQVGLARVLGVSRGAISDAERGRKRGQNTSTNMPKILTDGLRYLENHQNLP